MSYDYQKAKDVIKEILGDNYASVSSNLDKVFEIAISQSTDLTNLKHDIVKKNASVAELKVQHKKELDSELEKYNDYDSLKSQLDEKDSKLTTFEDQLKGFHAQKKNDLIELAKNVDFKEEKFEKRKEMFSYISDIEKMDNDQVSSAHKQLVRDLDLIGVDGLHKKGMTNQQPTITKKRKSEKRI